MLILANFPPCFTFRASLAKAGVAGSPYGIVQFDPYTRLTSTHIIQLKFAVRITVPSVIKSRCTKALELHLKMKNYDQYLMRATNDDENSKEDEKTGELLGRFPARCVPNGVAGLCWALRSFSQCDGTTPCLPFLTRQPPRPPFWW